MQTWWGLMEACAVVLLGQGAELWWWSAAAAGLRLELAALFLPGDGLPHASLAACSAPAAPFSISCWDLSMLLLLRIQFHLWSNQQRKGRLCVGTVTGNGIYFGTTDFSWYGNSKQPGNLQCSLLMLLCPVGAYCIAWGGEKQVLCIQDDTFLGLVFDSAPFFPFYCIKVNTEALVVVLSTVP